MGRFFFLSPFLLWQTGRHAFVWGNGLLNYFFLSLASSRLGNPLSDLLSFPSTSPWLNDRHERIFLISSQVHLRINVSNCRRICERRQQREQEVLAMNAIRQDNLIKCSLVDVLIRTEFKAARVHYDVKKEIRSFKWWNATRQMRRKRHGQWKQTRERARLMESSIRLTVTRERKGNVWEAIEFLAIFSSVRSDGRDEEESQEAIILRRVSFSLSMFEKKWTLIGLDRCQAWARTVSCLHSSLADDILVSISI